MSRRTAIVPALVLVFLLWGFGWPLLKICLDLRTGASVQESLLGALRERYPDHAFEGGGVGYTGPSVGIRVVGPVAPATQLEIKRFLQEEKQRQRLGFYIDLYFDAGEGAAEPEPVRI